MNLYKNIDCLKQYKIICKVSIILGKNLFFLKILIKKYKYFYSKLNNKNKYKLLLFLNLMNLIFKY